jgi:hypothetical protein
MLAPDVKDRSLICTAPISSGGITDRLSISKTGAFTVGMHFTLPSTFADKSPCAGWSPSQGKQGPHEFLVAMQGYRCNTVQLGEAAQLT